MEETAKTEPIPEKPIEETPTPQPEPREEKPSPPKEDPKDVARALLIEGKPSDEVAKLTGLSIRSVWGLKGGLARAKQIPTRKEEKEKEKIEAIAGVTPEREEALPFRREKSAPQLIAEICTKYGVKQRAARIIADRCRRVPGNVLHPGDFERLLLRLDTGLKRDEAMLIAEEYELALQQQKGLAEETRRGYYRQPSSTDRGRPSYAEEERYPSRRYEYETPRYDRYGKRLPPEREYGRPEVGRRDLEGLESRILEKIDRKREADKFDKIFDFIKNQSEDIATLATELKNIKENPPTTGQPSMDENPYVKALNVHLESAKEGAKETREAMKEQAKEFRELIRDERKEHKSTMERMEDKIENARKSGRSTEGYKDDAIRLAADGLNRFADVVEKKKPVEIIARFVAPEEGKTPPQRKKFGESRISTMVPEEYTEG